MTTREERLEAFASFPVRLRELAVRAAGRPTPTGEWGPSEVGRHLIAVEDEIHVKRLREVAGDDIPHWTWTEPGLAQAFAVARAATVGLFEALDDAAWVRYGTHATYGRLDVEGLLRLAVDHDAEHLESLTGSN